MQIWCIFGILKHSRCFVANLPLYQFARFCVNFGPKNFDRVNLSCLPDDSNPDRWSYQKYYHDRDSDQDFETDLDHKYDHNNDQNNDQDFDPDQDKNQDLDQKESI